MKYVSSLIAVESIERSKVFYTKILNQEIQHDFGENVSFHGGFAIHLKSHYEKLINKSVKQRNHSFELYFEHDDLEQFEQLLQNELIEFVHPLKEQPWRQLVVRFYDPDHHIIEVGESMPHLCKRLQSEGLSNAAINQQTGLPIAFIETIFNTNN